MGNYQWRTAAITAECPENLLYEGLFRMRFWDFDRSPASARLMLDFGETRGVTRAALLSGTGLSAPRLDDPEAEITAAQELRMAANLANLLEAAPGLGFELGRQYDFATFGIWGDGLLASATVAEAVAFALRFLPLTYAFTAIAFRDAGALAVLTFGAPPLSDRALTQFLVERDMGAAAALLAGMVGEDFALARFWMQGGDTALAGAAAAHVAGAASAELNFGARWNGLAVEPALLARPLPRANPVTAAVYEQMCKKLIERRRVHLGTATMVRHYLHATSDTAPFSLDEMARLLHVSTRTLKRRLHEEGTTFQTLLDEARGALARALLGDPRLTLSEIADLLRFSDLSSFSQAFKRWHGMAPRTYRANLQRAVPTLEDA